MSSATNSNAGTMLSLGFKGAGKPNGVPSYNQTGLFTLGGVQSSADSGKMSYGIVVSSDPASDDGIFTVGAATIDGVASVFSLTVTHIATTAGTINVDGTVITTDPAVQDTVAKVAALIAAATFSRFTAAQAGSTAVVNFTAKSATIYSAPSFALGTAVGVTATIATVTAGTMGSVPRGIVIYRPDVEMLDPSKPDYVLQGAPLAAAYFGQIWLASWLKTAAGAIDPILGCVVCASNTDGNIQFLAAGTSANPTGYSILPNCAVKSVSLDTNGVLLLVNI